MTYPTDATDISWQHLLLDASSNDALNAWIDLVWKEGYPEPADHLFRSPQYAPNLRALEQSREWTDYEVLSLFDGRTLPGENKLMKCIMNVLVPGYVGAINLWRSAVLQKPEALMQAAARITVAQFPAAPAWAVQSSIDMMVEQPKLADTSGALANFLAHVLRQMPPFNNLTIRDNPGKLAWLFQFHPSLADAGGRLGADTHLADIVERASHMDGVWKALANVMQGTGTIPELHVELIAEAPWTGLQMANSTATPLKTEDILTLGSFDERIVGLMRMGQALGVDNVIEWAKSQPEEVTTAHQSALPAEIVSSPL